MRMVLLGIGVLAAAAAAATSPASAQTYPWCAQYGFFSDGGRNCGFSTFAQCQATVSGIGGFCERNPMYVPRAKPSKRRR